MNFSTLVLVDRSGRVLRAALGWFMLLENLAISVYAIGLQLRRGSAKHEIDRMLTEHVQRQAEFAMLIQQLRSDLEKSVPHPRPLTHSEDRSRTAIIGRRKSSALGAKWVRVHLPPKESEKVDLVFSSPRHPCYGAAARASRVTLAHD